MNFLAIANLAALVAAQNSVEWSTYSFYSSLAGDYQCLLPYLPDNDASQIVANPTSFVEKLTASPATYYAGLLGLTTGCVWSGANANAAAEATGSAHSSHSAASEATATTDVASANNAAIGAAGVGAMAAAFVALM